MNIFRSNPLFRKIRFRLKKLRRLFSTRKMLNVFGTPNNGNEDLIQLVYVINLDRQPSRWEAVLKESCDQRINNGRTMADYLRRISAIDARNIDKTQNLKQVSSNYSIEAQYFVDPDHRLLSIIREKKTNIVMTVEEIAIAQSHIKVWERIVQENIKYALVLEDDVFFESNFAERLNASWKELPERRTDGYKFDILYLSYKEVERGAEKRHISTNMVKLTRGIWWMSGYVISYPGTLKLLNSLPVVGPVDLWINHLFRKIDVFCTPESIIFQRDDLKSDNQYSILSLISQIGIQTDKTLLELEGIKGSTPVFCIGYNSHDSQQLYRALSVLGYRCCNNQFHQFTKSINRSIIENRPLLFDAYIDNETLQNNLDYLVSFYPSAVILIPPSSKVDSTIEPVIFERMWNLFNHKSKCYLYDISIEKNWELICNLLNCKVPKFSFPRYVNNMIPRIDSVYDHQIELEAYSSGINLEHDVHPWIVPHQRLAAFGVSNGMGCNFSSVGSFVRIYQELFDHFDETKWQKTNGSFPSNIAKFMDENVQISENSCDLWLRNYSGEKYLYSAASFSSRKNYKYGRFEISLRAAKGDGIVTAFFLHRNDPWQEIDIEILGKDTKKVLFNVYYNPGDSGTKLNYGNRGTPTIFNLGFDASIESHTYAIEWNPFEIRWYIDNSLLHVRPTWSPTPIPDLEPKVYCSIWLPSSIELAGAVDNTVFPTASNISQISISKWSSVEV